MKSNSAKSLETHKKTGKLPRQRDIVYNAIEKIGNLGFTRHDLSEHLNIPLHAICARVRELLDDKLIAESGNVVVGNRPRAILKCQRYVQDVEEKPEATEIEKEAIKNNNSILDLIF